MHPEPFTSTEIDFPHPTGGRTEFYIVRHGRTEGNVRRVLVGRTDIPLDELGVRQAAAVAEYFHGFHRPDVILASPLDRARTTAKAISDLLQLPIEIEDDLAELNFGSYEGRSWVELLEQEPEFAAQIQNLEHDLQWPGGERLSEFHQRVRAVFSRLAARYDNHSAIVVSHGGVVGSLVSQLLGTPPNDWARYQIQNCSVTHMEIGSHRSVLHRLNDVEHLSALDSVVHG
ncbi:MAG: histidine phosphatase family protein [Chloroflexota bacterium]|nr:histidine phosphatase family protein [Chloroflexota bacterium]